MAFVLTASVREAQDISAYVMGGIDLCLFLFSLFQIFRIYYMDRENKLDFEWNAREVYVHVIICILMLDRGLFFVLQPTLIQGDKLSIPEGFFMIWIFSADLLFLLVYTVLLLFWIDLYYHMANGHQSFFAAGQPIIITSGAILAVISAALIGLFIYWMNGKTDKLFWVDNISALFTSGLFVVAAGLFLFFGIKISSLLRSFPVLRGRQKARKFGIIAGICTLCFLSRAGFTIWAVIAQIQAGWENFGAQFSIAWYWILVFFLALEILPIGLILFLFRKLPKWKRMESHNQWDRNRLLNGGINRMPSAYT